MNPAAFAPLNESTSLKEFEREHFETTTQNILRFYQEELLRHVCCSTRLLARANKEDASLQKAVILAAGMGSRMREPRSDVLLEPAQAAMADRGLKGMIPIAGRPFLDYVLGALADADYEHACLVIRPDQDLVRTYYTSTAPPTRINVAFAHQQMPRGTASAVLAAETFVGPDDFLMVNSDNYYPVSALTGLRLLEEPGLVAFQRDGLLSGNITVDRLSTYAVLFLGSDGYLERIVEKPDADLVMTSGEQHTFISMNCWRFSPRIFPACRAISLSKRGEFELAAAVQYAMKAFGERFRAIYANAPVLDLSNRGDVAAVTARLMAVDVRT